MTAPVVTTLTVVKIAVAADPRLVFLHRAAARLVLVRAGEMDLDDAVATCCRYAPALAMSSNGGKGNTRLAGNGGAGHDA